MPSWADRPEHRPKSGSAPDRAKVNCFGCKHLVITHQPDWPYACDFFGIRSRMIPSIQILKNSGEPCRSFTKQPSRP